MSFFETLTLVAHFSVLGALVIFGLHRYRLVWLAQNKRVNSKASLQLAKGDLPHITVQLPIYNERYVVERLIENVYSLSTPATASPQVLDDSTDDTSRIISKAIGKWQALGFKLNAIPARNGLDSKLGLLKRASLL